MRREEPPLRDNEVMFILTPRASVLMRDGNVVSIEFDWSDSYEDGLELSVGGERVREPTTPELARATKAAHEHTRTIVHPVLTDYHTECQNAYARTLEALRAQHLQAELIETGGSCKAIAITGIHDREFHARAHILLTADGPLTNQRDPTTHWEAGLYCLDEWGTEAVTMLTIDRELPDAPEVDTELALWMAGVAAMLR